MQRRRFLSGAGTVACSSLAAGCLGSAGLTASNRETTTDGIIRELPTVSWNEKQLSLDSFALTVTVEFNDAETVVIKTNREPFYTFTAAGQEKQTAKIAGKGTENGTLNAGTILNAYVGGESIAFSTYTVGMQQDVSP